MRRGLVRILVPGLGVVAGVATVSLARAHPDLSLSGDRPTASAALLAAGWGLIAAGLGLTGRQRGTVPGTLLVAAGFAWFAVEAADPEVGSSLAFTGGLLFAAAGPALVAHAVLVHAGGRPVSRWEGAVVAAGYVACLGVAGVVTTLMNDPAAQGCLDCPANPLAVGTDPEAATRLALRLVSLWSVLAVATLAARVVRAGPARRRLDLPVLGPAAVYVALAGAQAAHGVSRGFVSNDPTDRRLWAGQALGCLGVAAGVAWERVRSARMRSRLGDLVVELGAAPGGGGVQDALARGLGDPGLVLVYRRTGDDGWIDREGHPVEPPLGAGAALGDVAALTQRPEALRDPDLVREIARAARTPLENERLDAELKAQLAELRASQARIVRTGDAERRRLERDLHDGAQQRIVAVALELRLARRRLARETTAHDDELASVEADLQRAVEELRELAHGLHPHTLQESGLAVALRALAETDPRLAVDVAPHERPAAATELAAYQVASETLRGAPTGLVEVRGHRSDGRLVVEVEADAAPSTLVALEDRVGALDGRLVVDRRGSRVTLRAELPCGS